MRVNGTRAALLAGAACALLACAPSTRPAPVPPAGRSGAPVETPIPRPGELDKGVFDGDFAERSVQAEPGTLIPLTLQVTPRSAVPAGEARLLLPAGLALHDGASQQPFAAWPADEARTFVWTVRAGAVQGAVILARVQAGAETRSFAVTVNPQPAAGEVQVDAQGRTLRVHKVRAQ